MTTAYITHPDCLLHQAGLYHPEAPARLRAIEDRLIAAGLMDLLRHYVATPASDAQLCRVHSAAYLEELGKAVPGDGLVILDGGDTGMNRHSLAAARLAAGALVQAVDLVLAGEVDNAFCAVRPPGHHAEPDRAMGFCLFNNVAVGAAHALAQDGIARVAIVDFDVHHGNGTETMLGGDRRVLFCSSFQHPYYPFSRLEGAADNVIHMPLPAGAGSEAFREAMQSRCLPALEAFAPDLVLVSAGFDGHREDELAQLNLVEADYAWITERLVDVASRHCHGRIVATLEGGYALDALGRSAAAHIKVLMGVA